jgi:hypothetical protein
VNSKLVSVNEYLVKKTAMHEPPTPLSDVTYKRVVSGER